MTLLGGKGLKGGRGYASMSGGSGYAKLGFTNIGQEGMNHNEGMLPEPFKQGMVNLTSTQAGGRRRRRRGTKRRCTTKRSGSKRRGSKRRGTTKRRKTHKRKH